MQSFCGEHPYGIFDVIPSYQHAHVKALHAYVCSWEYQAPTGSQKSLNDTGWSSNVAYTRALKNYTTLFELDEVEIDELVLSRADEMRS